MDRRRSGTPPGNGISQHLVVIIRDDRQVISTNNLSPIWYIGDGKFYVCLRRTSIRHKAGHTVERAVRSTDKPAQIIKAELNEEVVWLVSADHGADQFLILGNLASPDGKMSALKIRRDVRGIATVCFHHGWGLRSTLHRRSWWWSWIGWRHSASVRTNKVDRNTISLELIYVS